MSTCHHNHRRLLLVAVILGAVFWVFEAMLHVYVFHDVGLLEQIVAPPAHEIWMRLTVMFLFLLFGFYAQRMLDARRRAEEASRQASAELAQIFDTAADGMRVVDRDFNVLRANDTFAAMAGLPKEEIVGRKCYEVFRGPLCDTPNCPLLRVLGNQKRVEYDAEKQRRDGVKLPCIVTATPFMRPDGEILGIVEDFKDISERRKAEQDLVESQARLQQLTAHLLEVREEERTRIARELHDELGQALTALNMDLRWLRQRLPAGEPGLQEKADSMKGLIDQTMKWISRVCSELRPGILDDFGLSAAVQWQADEFSGRTGIPCHLRIHPEEILVDPLLSTSVFRIFQEALTNVARHAEATRVHARLEVKGRSLEMQVCDNGKGFGDTQPKTRNSFGLIGIRERVREGNGEFRIGKGIDGGGCIEICMPLDEMPEAKQAGI